MKMSRQPTMLLAMWMVSALTVPALAADSTLTLVMGGEAYDGPPKFAVSLDGKPIGEGTVAAAIDTATAGRFADAADKTPYVQSFTFKVPEAAFAADGDVVIEFLNEAYGGPGSDRDRTLFLASVSLNGRAVTASGLTIAGGGATDDGQMLGEFLVIADGTRDAVSKAPPGGWPLPVGDVATVSSDAGPSAVADASAEPERSAVVVAPAASDAPDRMETASVELDPRAAEHACDLDEKYNVIGFNANSNDLTPRLIERLDQVVGDIGERQCNVTVTGYSSKQGSTASNALFAIERAQNALRYLQQNGVKFIEASATGVGATDEFGPDFASNRRVVITVTP